jgi:trehalose utilization protein
MASRIRVTVWGENLHEQSDEAVRAIYPEGMHACIAQGLGESGEFEVRCATLEQPEHGLSQEVLDQTDVLTWWGHRGHAQVSDAVVERVLKRVWEGMGLLVLHSAHYSKIFKRLLGTSCSLSWRVAHDKERVWVCSPGHPIAQGLGPYFELSPSEMYGEPFAIPTPDEQVFISWFSGGEIFRSGCTWRRGAGRIFYFGPGHEIFPIYWDPNVRRVLKNAARWAAPQGDCWVDRCERAEPPEA